MEASKKPADKYIIDIKDYQLVRNINSGGFGTINLVKNIKNGNIYAAKTNLIPNKTQNKLFISREIRILIQIQHPTIIQFRGFSYLDFNGNKNITILMDYMKEGSLADLIAKEQKSLCPPNYDNTKRQIILVGVARGMMVLHAHHVIQRDLKPENILLDSEFHPCITDFGLSKVFDPYHSMNQSSADTGTAAYMAPEVINSDHYNTKADVYAFGILMYEVLLGKRAYDSLMHGKKKLNMFQLKKKVSEGLRPEIKPGDIKNSFQTLIEKCWSENPKERPTFSEIYKKLSLSREDFFSQFDENYQEPAILDDDDDDENEDDELGTTLNKKYLLDDVDLGEFLDYLDIISQEATSAKNKKDDELMNEMEEMKKTIKKQADEIESLKSQLKNSRGGGVNPDSVKQLVDQTIRGICPAFISAEPSLDKPGILSILKSNEKSKFRDRLFIASSSKMDIYNLIDPNTKDYFDTADIGDFIEFELEHQIPISGLQIYSESTNYPQSFDIEIDGRTVSSIKGTKELNGPGKVMNVKFEVCQGKKVRFKQTGPSLDKGRNFLFFKRFELLSPDFPDGVFSSFIKSSKDPHRCPVYLSASLFDFNSFTSLSPRYNISIPGKDQFFQIELTRGVAVLTGCRIKRWDRNLLRHYKIVCSDDSRKPLDLWTTLLEVDEKSKDEHKILDTYMFQYPSPPAKFLRIIYGLTWNDNYYFNIYHFDLFGVYI